MDCLPSQLPPGKILMDFLCSLPWFLSPYMLPASPVLPGCPAQPQSPVFPLPRGPGPPSLPLFRLRSTSLLDFIKVGASGSRSLGVGYVTIPVYELLFIHHQRSLAHHIDSCITLTVAGHPWTTVPIIHCTDDAHTTDCTDHTQLIPICTLSISHGLSLCDRRVLYSVYHSPSDSYSTESS